MLSIAEKLRNTPSRHPHPTDYGSKPVTVQQTRNYFQRVEKYLDSQQKKTPIPSILSVKRDGCSGSLQLAEGMTQSDDTLGLRYRTAHGKLLANIPHPELYLRKEALDRHAQLDLEICAMLYGTQELGHYYVEAAVTAFVKNGYTNKGPLHLHLRAFGLHSIRTGGATRTPTAPQSIGLLKELIVPGNGLLDVVQYREYTITKHSNDLLFRDKASGAVVAADYDVFCKKMLADTREDGKEGWVLSVPDYVLMGAEPTEPDGFGTHRVLTKLKVKQEFTGQYVALKVDCLPGAGAAKGARDGDTEEKTEIWLYGVDSTNTMGLRYVANVTGHEPIEAIMRDKAASMSYADDDKAEKKALYKLHYNEACGRGAGKQIQVTCANVTRNGFLLGVKKYGTKRASLDYSEVTATLKMAAENPHFVSTKRAQDALRKEMAHIQDEEAQLFATTAWKKHGDTKQKKRSLAAPVVHVLDDEEDDEDVLLAEEEEEAPQAKLARRVDPLEQEIAAYKKDGGGGRVYRVLDPAPVIYIDGKGWCGPERLSVLQNWFAFLGGKIVHQPGPSVTVVVTLAPAIARMPDPLCICMELKAKCHPTVRFTTKDDLPALMRDF